jgi:hypothetical protein
MGEVQDGLIRSRKVRIHIIGMLLLPGGWKEALAGRG